MISKQMVAWGESGGSIREIAAYGERRAAEIGPENVYNFAIGNPSIDPPDCVQEADGSTCDCVCAVGPSQFENGQFDGLISV